MQMKTREEYDIQPRNQFFDSHSQNRPDQSRSSVMVKIRMLSSLGQKRTPAIGPPANEPCRRLTDWPVY
jgi:hypothetical protein